MKICIFGGAGFIGTNLTIRLNKDNKVILVDQNDQYFNHIRILNLDNVTCIAKEFNQDTNYDELVQGADIIYHLISTTAPTTSNHKILEEITSDVIVTIKLLDACVRNNIKKVIFISSGGTVYGLESSCPLSEDLPTDPICSYGVQKITIEKLLYLYEYLYKLDYRIIRLANPYGPYQRPNGILGAATTFTYKALKDETIDLYGDGSIIRDFIYIDDAINGIINIADGNSVYKIFNLGSGKGTSLKELLETIEKVLNKKLKINYLPAREVDVPANYLNIDRYENTYGKLNPISLEEGILKTAEFIQKHYK